MNQSEVFNIKTEAEFQILMEKIDKELKENDLAIFQRPIHAWKNISSRYRLGLQMTPRRKEIIEGCYTGDDLTLRIFRWYEEKYGERLKVDRTWKIAVFIKNDLFKIKIPTIYGKVELFAPNDISEIETVFPNIGVNEVPKINIFNLIEDIKPNLIKSLTYEDVHYIMRFCQLGSETKFRMERHKSISLVKQAISDLSASVSHLFETQPNSGLSKWSSLQATEKTLKAYIHKKNSTFPKTHNLVKLRNLAQDFGLSSISPNLIDLIQCDAGIRYGTPQISLYDALQAHHASLMICHDVVEQL